MFDISPDFQRQLEKRLGVIMGQYETKPREVEEAPAPKPPSTPAVTTTTLKVQPPPFAAELKTSPPAAPPAPTAQKAPPPPLIIGPQKVVPQTGPTPTTTAPAAEATTTQKPPSEAQSNLVEELNKIKGQLAQEAIKKNVTQERIVELTQKYQSQMARLFQEKNQLGTQVNEMKNKFEEEARRRVAAENRLSTVTGGLKTEIEKIKLERDALLGGLKESQTKLQLFQEAQVQSAASGVEVTRLKAKLSQVEREKEDIEARAVKLESLLNELRKGQAQPQPVKEVIVPQEAAEESRVPVKIIQPAPAVGKMAPALTTIPNVVNGIMKDRDGMLITEVIIVVKDQAGDPVRALKSNKIGQFAISTPLPNGTYTMELEKEGHEFDVVQIELKGKIIPPIEIRAR